MPRDQVFRAWTEPERSRSGDLPRGSPTQALRWIRGWATRSESGFGHPPSLTEMTLTQERFANENERDQRADGWKECLERLANGVI